MSEDDDACPPDCESCACDGAIMAMHDLLVWLACMGIPRWLEA